MRVAVCPYLIAPSPPSLIDPLAAACLQPAPYEAVAGMVKYLGYQLAHMFVGYFVLFLLIFIILAIIAFTVGACVCVWRCGADVCLCV